MRTIRLKGIQILKDGNFIFLVLIDCEFFCEETDSMKIARVLYDAVEIHHGNWRKINAILKKYS